MRLIWILQHAVAVATVLVVSISPATSADVEVEFTRDIRPIFSEHCVECHGGVKQVADLSFVYREQTLSVIEPGDPDDSHIIERVESEDVEQRMPPPEHGRRLTGHEVELLRKWIGQGAKWQRHWAFESPRRSTPPETKRHDWCRQPIDNFILARLQNNGLQPSPDASPDRWLRRVSLDLIGLPPTPDNRDAFFSAVSRSGEAAYENEVQRLLNSPRFGERWAGMWLDLVRYADSKGLGQDRRRTVWKYRDWVIDALNRDMPFDEFTVKQLAGDLLPDPSMDDLIATACHRLTQTNEEGGTDDEQFRLEAVIDRVNTTWQVWQGLTFGCVQCHNHPYDPIRHKEYYQFLSFFNNTMDCDLTNDDPRLPVPLSAKDYERANELDRKIADLRQGLWRSGFRLLDDRSRWQSVSGLQASATNRAQVHVQQRNETDEFYTRGVIPKGNAIVLETPLAKSVGQITAIRITALPLDPVKGKVDSEWGFVFSHVQAALLAPESDEPVLIELSRVIGDEPFPINDPQLSLDDGNPQGFGAHSRINHARHVAFVPAKPIEVQAGWRLRVTLWHDVIEGGAFPLVTRRGRMAVSNDSAFTEWLADPDLLASRQQLTRIAAERATIRSVPIPVMRERYPPLLRPTHVFERGNFLMKGEPVRSATPEFLPPLDDDANPTRLHLARWIASPHNPLTGPDVRRRIGGDSRRFRLVGYAAVASVSAG